MCSSCQQSMPTSVNRGHVASIPLTDCVYSLEFLQILYDQVDETIKPFVRSQINIYSLNCNLYAEKIQQLLDNQGSRAARPRA